MSKATKRKHVTKEVLDDYILPTEDQSIVKVFIFLLSPVDQISCKGTFCTFEIMHFLFN